MLVIPILGILTIACSGSESGTVSMERAQHVQSNATSQADSSTQNDVAIVNALRGASKYIGCWAGMGGGRLRITDTTIYDLGSGEQSSYKELPTDREGEPRGLETGEVYLLMVSTRFPKSFLSKFIRLSFNADKTVGIVTYDSHEDYVHDNYVGQGLFEKTRCK